MPLKGFKYIIVLTAITTILSDYFSLTIFYFILKLLITSLIILLSLLNASVKNSLFAKPIIIGLIFCLIGDLSLLFEDYFTIGLFSFFIPVLLYIVFIVMMSLQGIFLKLSSYNQAFKSVGYAVSLFMFSNEILTLNKFYIHFS